MSGYLTPNQFESKYRFGVVRPTMHPDREEARGNGGTEVHMLEGAGGGEPIEPEPERDPLKVTTAAKWAARNVYAKGQTVYARVAIFEGGLPETTEYRWRVQTRATPDDNPVMGTWNAYSNAPAEIEFEVKEAGGQIRFQCQARDTGTDPVEQASSLASWENVAELLTVSSIKITGTAQVGMILTGSHEVSGGVPPYYFVYLWKDYADHTTLFEGTLGWKTYNLGGEAAGKQIELVVLVEDSLYNVATATGPTPTEHVVVPPLVVSELEIYGEPWAGETLTASIPEVSGGTGLWRRDYLWSDGNGMRDTTLTSDTVGTSMTCTCTVTDTGWPGGEVVVKQAQTDVIKAPWIGPITMFINGEPYDENEAYELYEFEDEAMMTIELNEQEGPNRIVPEWELRSGSARLTPNGYSCYLMNQTEASSGISVQVNCQDVYAGDDPRSARFSFYVLRGQRPDTGKRKKVLGLF